ncbi:hypothetical protein [Streptomyces capitiformicae]|uniref:Uncharacterized protein n=1 Tax=Streptomyces capitiformicae TaxID=2014920 RepID=A0A919DMJ9_9ACTN|nr:hypothetical protein [Streptomyces capitiformicae]GHE63573.1 hypothetical protein GCM10017771_86960 [Streptomyces capitiformicae]
MGVGHLPEQNVGGGAVALLGPLTTGTAVVSSAGEQGAARVLGGPYVVVPYETVNVRTGPARPFPSAGTVAAGEARGAYCWEFGELISDYGFTNRVDKLTSRHEGSDQYQRYKNHFNLRSLPRLYSQL